MLVVGKAYPEIDGTFLIKYPIRVIKKLFELDFDHVTAASSLMDQLLDLSKNSIQYGNSTCPSMIRKLKVIVYFRKVFLLSKFKYVCFVTSLDMSLISRSCKNDHIIFNVGTPSLEARNIRLVNIITYVIEESKLISENISPNVIHC